MPTAASAALRAAVHDALTNDAALIATLGGTKIYDEPPREAAFPYVTLGEMCDVLREVWGEWEEQAVI